MTIPIRSFFSWIRPPQRPSTLPPSGTPGAYTPTPKPPPSKPIPAPHKPNATPGAGSGAPVSKENALSNWRQLALESRNKSTTGASATNKLPSTTTLPPKTFGDVTQNLVTADRLVKAGVFKTGPDLKTVARDALVNASVNGLVNTPLSIATYAGSVWTGETIKGAFAPNTPLLPPAHQPAPSQQAAATAGQAPTTDDPESLKWRMENAELKFVIAANTSLLLDGETGEDSAVGVNPKWPTAVNERLAIIEQHYKKLEEALAVIADRNDLVFRPHKRTPVAESDTKGRLDELDKTNEAINDFINRMILIGMKYEKKEPSKETPQPEVV